MEQQVSECFAQELKNRAIVLKANQKDLEKIKDFILGLSEVKLVYLATAPSNVCLRVVKEPYDKQPFEHALFTLDVDIER